MTFLDCTLRPIPSLSSKGEPYINACGYDAAGSLLQHLFRGTLAVPNASALAYDVTGLGQGALVSFDQVRALANDTFGPEHERKKQDVFPPSLSLSHFLGRRPMSRRDTPSSRRR